MLLDVKKAVKISDYTYKMLHSSDGLCSLFYGLRQVGRQVGLYLMRVTCDSNKTDNLMALKKTKQTDSNSCNNINCN